MSDVYEYSGSEAAQAGLYADVLTLKCDTGFIVLGLRDGEAICTPIRVISTLVTMSVASAWFSRRKSIKMLLLFFTHWLSGLLHMLAFMAETTMISVCWSGDNLIGFIKAFKFLELASSNMLAVTNLAICVNLALIIMSHRTLSRVRSVSSPVLIFIFLAISVGAAAASVPAWEFTVVSGTAFWVSNYEQRAQHWIIASSFFIEFFVGASMLVIVTWLLLFRMKEIKECYKIHMRIRFYFGLTLIATAVNLAVGVCGTIYLARDLEGRPDMSMGDVADMLFLREVLVVISWAFRYLHIALDTVVLYGVLGARNVDERSGPGSSTSTATGTDPGGVGASTTSGFALRTFKTKARALSGKSSSNGLAASSGGGGFGRLPKVHSEVAFPVNLHRSGIDAIARDV